MRFDHPIIKLHGDVDDSMARQFRQEIADARGAFETSIRIDSEGGSVWSMLDILEGMKAHDGRINTICTGRASSAAAVIFLAGQKRLICPDARIMLHRAFYRDGGEDETCCRLSDTIAEILSHRAGVSLTQAQLWLRAEQFFDAAHSLHTGIATGLASQSLQTSRPSLDCCTIPERETSRTAAALQSLDAVDWQHRRLERQRKFREQANGRRPRGRRELIVVPPMPPSLQRPYETARGYGLMPSGTHGAY